MAIIAGVLVTGSWRGDFRVDEAFKISETPFLGLWLRGDVRNPAWFANIVDRINPPTGKYAFGAAILLTRQALPPLPTLAVRDPDIPALHSRALSAPYRPMLHAVRFASTLSIALTAALLTAILARYHGWVSAVSALAFFALNDVTRTFWATGVFDPLLTLFFMVSVALMTVLAAGPSARRAAIIGFAIGIVTALAFQTRLNGLFAFVIAVPFLWMTLRRTIRTAILATALATGAFVATTLILNPYYWSTPAIPLAPFSGHAGPMRPVDRLVQQHQDLRSIAIPWQYKRSEARTLAEKMRFLFEMTLGELPGRLMVFGAATGVVLLPVRWRSVTPALRTALLMSLAVLITIVATLPMPWMRYLLVGVPPLALLAGFATAEVLRASIREWRQAAEATDP
ncbi:MAG TPA: hypothetical protein VFV49_15935 [Thermoanaerobaculia bacterium]|nr:hypothetical protein [Thermoanaerobaculia bacterium]